MNNTELSLSGSCPTLDLDYNIYIEEALHGHLVAQLAFVPAAALAGLALTVLQRPKMIGTSCPNDRNNNYFLISHFNTILLYYYYYYVP